MSIIMGALFVPDCQTSMDIVYHTKLEATVCQLQSVSYCLSVCQYNCVDHTALIFSLLL